MTPHHASAIAADAAIRARFPYQQILPRDGSLGIGLLSSFPILDVTTIANDPPLIRARLDAGGGRSFQVVVAHPVAGVIPVLGPLPIPTGFDPSKRDAEIAAMRAVVDPLLAAGDPLVLVGDFNTTDREPAYAEISRGMIDLQHAVGFGPGATWRPDPVKWLPFGLLRIDMVFAANGVAPIAISPDCTPRGSDHCVVRATVAVP